MTSPLPTEPHDGIKADAGPETAVSERDQTSYAARGGSNSGAADTGPAPADEQPSLAIPGGTAGGDPLSGVTATEADVEDAVSGDTGPAHPGTRA